MNNIFFYGAVILAGLMGVCVFGQETLTVTRENGTTISVGENTLVEMQTGEDGQEAYILIPALSSELASVTIISPTMGEAAPKQPETRASGKKITIWLPSVEQGMQAGIEFLIEGDALVVQGSDRMRGPTSIEFKDRVLTILGSDNKEGHLLYTFQDGRRVDWEGQSLRVTFDIDERGRYFVNGFKTLKPAKRLNVFDPRLKGGVAHLIPTGRSPGTESGDLARKVSPSKQ